MSTTAGADPPPVRDAYVRLASIFCLHVALRRAASKPGRRPASIASPCARFVQPHLSIHRASSCDLQSAATNLEIEAHVPEKSSNPNIRTSMGSAAYAPERDAMVWNIKLFPGGTGRNEYAVAKLCIRLLQPTILQPGTLSDLFASMKKVEIIREEKQ